MHNFRYRTSIGVIRQIWIASRGRANHFQETLRRTPGPPKAIAGIARAAAAMGDTAAAQAQYTEEHDDDHDGKSHWPEPLARADVRLRLRAFSDIGVAPAIQFLETTRRSRHATTRM